MNQLDSELVVGQLERAGYEITDDRSKAQVLLYNTCSVRFRAEEKVYSKLGDDAKRKRNGDKLIVGVLGCLAQAQGEVLTKRWSVDIVCAPGQLHRLADMLDDARSKVDDARKGSKSRGDGIVALDPDRKSKRSFADERLMDSMDLSRDPNAGVGSSQAFVRVMRGCDKFCSYCIVPFVRGPERSRSPADIICEVRKLVDAGRSEITLIGQTVNSYCFSDGGTSVRFSDLLAGVSAIAGLERLRFVTSYPSDFGDDILQAMRDLPNICEYIHVPAQSGSDIMLKAMNRRYSRAEYDDLIDRAKAIVPNVALAGDFIVGFPGESESDHQASADLIKRTGYKNSFIFKYSPRPNTLAAKRLTDDVPKEVKRRRNIELLAVQKEAGIAHHAALVGKNFDILVTGPSSRSNMQDTPATDKLAQMQGRSRGDHIVVFDGSRDMTGKIIPVDIVGATSITLLGRA